MKKKLADEIGKAFIRLRRKQMNIIKDGTITVPIIRFECNNCGCVFEADKGEYKYSSQMEVMHDGLGAYKCECPCCKNMVYTERK